VSNDYGTIINEFLDAAGKLVGVDVKEAFKDLIEDITIGYQKADGKHAAQDDDFDEVRDVLDKLGVDKPIEGDNGTASDNWEIAFPSAGFAYTDTFTADHVETDGGELSAYQGSERVFIAAAGDWTYAKKVAK